MKKNENENYCFIFVVFLVVNTRATKVSGLPTKYKLQLHKSFTLFERRAMKFNIICN